MTSSARGSGIVLVVCAALGLLTTTVWAGDFKSQATIGGSFFSASPPCPVKQFPAFESIAPIPAIVDPFDQDLIPMFCQIQVTKDGNGVKKAKGSYTTELFLIDNDTGIGERIFIESGSFRTKGADGNAKFDFDIPTEIFADGFESGDVSAWSYTRTSFANNKKASTAAVSCQTSASRSD